jgi:proteasome assembly chaperone (PAC2) family protein
MTSLVYLSRMPELRRPFLIAGFEGWSDAGDAATSAVRYLRGTWDAQPLASIDPEEFFDFQAHRPLVRVNEEGIREITWPATEFTHASVPGAEHDVVLLQGIEPSMRWPTFTKHVIDVARESGAELVVGLGALLAGRPHTRPIRVSGTASTPELSSRFGLANPRYEGPTGILGVLMDACRREDIPAVTLWGWVPHYLQGSPSPPTALAVLQRLSALLEVPIDLTELEERSRSHEARVNEAMRSDPDITATVEELERQADAEDMNEIPSGEELAAEVERYLRNQRGER